MQEVDFKKKAARIKSDMRLNSLITTIISYPFCHRKMTFLSPQSQWWSIIRFEDNLIVVKLILILSRQMCGTFDDHGSTLFEGWTLNNICFGEIFVSHPLFKICWNMGNLWFISYDIMTVQPIGSHFNNLIASECNLPLDNLFFQFLQKKHFHIASLKNKISPIRLHKSVYSNSTSRNFPRQRFFASPKKKTSKNHVQLVLHSFLRLQFHLQVSGNFAENLINFEATCTASKFRRDPDSMEEHCTMAQHISEEGLVFSNSSTWIHYQAAHLQHLSFQPWCLESSQLGGYSVCTSWETPKVSNRIVSRNCPSHPPTNIALRLWSNLVCFHLQNLRLFDRDANLPACESVRSSAQSAPRTNPCLVFPSVQRWFTSSRTRKLTWNPRMKIFGRWFSFWKGWFSGSWLVFRGVR